MASQSLCSILISEEADLDDAVTSVYFAKFILNGTTDAIRVSFVNRITYGYIAPVIISFGIIGDIMTVATLTRSLFKRSPIIYTYLILLAITDLASFSGECIDGCKRMDCGISNNESVHGCLSSFSSSLSQLPPGIASCRFVICDRKIEMWYKAYEWCRETISRLLPFVLVAYFNSKILITYRSTKKERFQRLAFNQQKISTKTEQEEKQLFTLLFSIVIIFFICTIPAAPLTIFVSDKRSFNVPFQ
ncbi:unnamed protein product, partial [Acanthocheilonema viteae]